MSAADEAWQEWLDDNGTIAFAFPLEDGGHELNLAFLAGYRRALEDAADEISEYSMTIGDALHRLRARAAVERADA